MLNVYVISNICCLCDLLGLYSSSFLVGFDPFSSLDFLGVVCGFDSFIVSAGFVVISAVFGR